jgi:hypothetical protein
MSELRPRCLNDILLGEIRTPMPYVESPSPISPVRNLDLCDDDLLDILAESTKTESRPSASRSQLKSRVALSPNNAIEPPERRNTADGIVPVDRVYELINMLESTLAEAKSYRDNPSSHDPWMPYEEFTPRDATVARTGARPSRGSAQISRENGLSSFG